MANEHVSEDLRKVEKDIDVAYRENLLCSLPRVTAVCCLLASCEELFVRQVVHLTNSATPPSIHEESALADAVINQLKWPLIWLLQSCPVGGQLGCGYDGERYHAAWKLSELAHDYVSYESAFTYASKGLLSLALDDHTIVTTGPIRDDTRYDAYDRLVDTTNKATDSGELLRILDLVAPTVRIDGPLFSYHLTPRLIKQVLASAGPLIDNRFELPADWRLTSVTIGEYRAILRALWGISVVHFAARIIAAMNGCLGLGYDRALVVMTRGELVARLSRYSGLTQDITRSIVGDLTYGGGGIHNPDPALQPLIELERDTLVWAPNLVINSSLERNLLVLLNRRPDGKDSYSRLSDLKEGLLRETIKRQIEGLDLRVWHGSIPGWGSSRDIDCAIISDNEECCLLLELKSFVAPAEPNEIIDKSKEIARGIRQVRTRQASASSSPEPLLTALGITNTYRVFWAVASETSIGAVWVQAADVPVVNTSHLVARLITAQSLFRVCEWLEHREYLPQEGRDYSTVDIDIPIGAWSLAWFGIKVLTAEHH